jgi:hypothetical protein
LKAIIGEWLTISNRVFSKFLMRQTQKNLRKMKVLVEPFPTVEAIGQILSALEE